MAPRYDQREEAADETETHAAQVPAGGEPALVRLQGDSLVVVVPPEPIAVAVTEGPPLEEPMREEVADPDCLATNVGIETVQADSAGHTEQECMLMEPVDGNHAHEEPLIGQGLGEPCTGPLALREQQINAQTSAQEVDHLQALSEPLTMHVIDEEHSTGGMTDQEVTAYGRLKAFCTNIMKKLAPPLLREVQASALRPDA